MALEAARRGHGSRLVLISPFTSVVELGQHMFPVVPVRWLTKDHFDSAAKAPEVRVPVLIVQGTRDELVPVEMTQGLAARFPFPNARTEWVENAGHNDIFRVGGDALIPTGDMWDSPGSPLSAPRAGFT